MKHYGLIGEHLGHSLSVPIHEVIFRTLGLDADYQLIEIPRDHFSDTLPRVLTNFDGLNVTIPYKKDVLPFLDSLSPVARNVGAVNTVQIGGTITGYNTDVRGFSDMLRLSGIHVKGKPCFILGTGGASLAVFSALQTLGAKSITFVSRSPSGEQIGYSDLPEQFSGILVNCTPAGMYPDTASCPIPDDLLPGVLSRAEGVADLIYNPPQTRLTHAASIRGIPNCTGLPMLICQAIEAERVWQGHDLPDSLYDAVYQEVSHLL